MLNFIFIIIIIFTLQGVEHVRAYIPDAVWYDYETVSLSHPMVADISRFLVSILNIFISKMVNNPNYWIIEPSVGLVITVQV